MIHSLYVNEKEVKPPLSPALLYVIAFSLKSGSDKRQSALSTCLQRLWPELNPSLSPSIHFLRWGSDTLSKNTMRRSSFLYLSTQTPQFLLRPATQPSGSCQGSCSASGRWMNTSLRWSLPPLFHLCFLSSLSVSVLFFKCDYMFWSPTRAPRVNADYIWSHDYTFSLV